MNGFNVRLKYIITLIILLESLVIIAVPPAIAIGNPIIRFVALNIFVISVCYLILLVATSTWATKKIESKEKKTVKRKDATNKSKVNLATRIMTRITFNGRLNPYLPIIGIAVVIIDIWYNFTYTGLNFGETDTTAILFGVMLIIYSKIPQKFSWERDFVMLFSIVLVLILIVPLMITRVINGNPEENVNMYSRVLLGPSLVAILNVIGITSGETSPPIGTPGGSNYPWIYYYDANGAFQKVGISAACAGLYSFSIFVGLFSAFVLVSFNRLNLKIGLLLVIGFLTSFLSNLFRMALIVIVSFYYGPGMMVWWTHEYAGLLIFLFWLAIFWWFLMKYIKIEKSEFIDKNGNKGKKG